MLRMNKLAWSRESEGKRKAEKEVQEEQDDVDGKRLRTILPNN